MAYIPLIITSILFLIGVIGTVLPVLPGAVLIYGGMILYGFMTDFSTLTTNFFLLQGLALLLIFAVDFLATAVGTKKFGGSRRSAFGATLGTLLGLFLFPPFGIILGPFLGAVAAELLSGKKSEHAIRVGIGTLIGLLGGTILKLLIEAVMIISFFLAI
ncbi:MAG: DUF456 domain-containing protein [Firmicutes bacterium]|nr:DUF456 domain-containing protein [Bacillota bacterium]